MVETSTWTHLRISSSFQLAPVYFFAWSQIQSPFSWNALVIFTILHFLLYPACNGFSSYFYKNEGLTIRHPPVTKELFYASLFLETCALIISALEVNPNFLIFIIMYGVTSKLNSYPGLKLEERPVLGWLVTAIVQGYITFMGIQCSTHDDLRFLRDPRLNFAGILCTLGLLGMYPLSRIYKYEEDKRRRKNTISVFLGVEGTFKIAIVLFSVALMGFLIFIKIYYSHFVSTSAIFIGLSLPIFQQFTSWIGFVLLDKKDADFKQAMRMNLVTSLCMNIFYIWLTVYPVKV